MNGQSAVSTLRSSGQPRPNQMIHDPVASEVAFPPRKPVPKRPVTDERNVQSQVVPGR